MKIYFLGWGWEKHRATLQVLQSIRLRSTLKPFAVPLSVKLLNSELVTVTETDADVTEVVKYS